MTSDQQLQTFLDMAARTRETAATTHDPQITAALLRVAVEFDGIAQRIIELRQTATH